ncbi:MAG TPA: cyclic nucleotide-binding domain-containing protein [Candidatus Polarisedimenticolia bacterium]|nr:cyclic nucleotide-binding domain-containing protein [Candidatus Polarisedimenticolia bacterium]
MAADPFKDLTTRYKKGDMIFKEGDLGSEMFVVQSGAVRIFREIDGVKQELAIMEKGDFFGEFAVLEGLPRTSSAEALDPTDLIEINTTTFDKMIRSNIEIAVRMLRKLSNRLQEANHKIELLSRATTSGKGAPARLGVVDVDRPSEAPPPAVNAPPAVGVQAAPQPIADVEVPQGALALLIFEGGSRLFPITGDTALIGRYDPVTGTRPEIDLTQVDINRSVSRRHAKIVVVDGAFQISEEVGALNGTFVNGQRLTSGKPATIVSGDKVGLGMVSLIFKTAERGTRKTAPARKS